MPEISQQVNVQFAAAGNLPRELAAARQQAREANTHLAELRKNVQQLQQRRNQIVTPEGVRLLREQAALQKQIADAQKSAVDPAWRTREAMQQITRAAAVAFGVGSAKIVGLGGLFNPYAAERFSWALKDAGAAVGRDLVPYLDKATRWVRELGDWYVRLDPSIRKTAASVIFWGTAVAGAVVASRALMGLWAAGRTVFAAMGVLGAAGAAGAGGGAAGAAGAAAAGGLLARHWKKALGVGAVAVAVNEMTDKGDGSGGAIEKGAGTIGNLLKAGVRNTVGRLFMSNKDINRANQMDVLGEKEKYGTASADELRRLKEMRAQDAGSYGMAARPASMMGAESYLQALQVDALRAGGRPEERTAGAAEEIRDLIKSGMLGGIGGTAAVEDIPQIGERGLFGGFLGATGYAGIDYVEGGA